MSDLDRVRTSVRIIEACLESSDWDALTALDASPLSVATGVDDVESLTEVLGEVQQLQHRIEVAMGAIREELDDVPQMRKAARAYNSVA
jgi:hypothetical protein